MLQAQSSCQRHSVRRQPFSSNSIQHGSSRHGAHLTCQARKLTKGHANRFLVANSAELRKFVEDLKQQVQKQKTAAVLGAFGILASGMALAGEDLGCVYTAIVLGLLNSYEKVACDAAGPGVAGDMVKTGTCLLGKCQVSTPPLSNEQTRRSNCMQTLLLELQMTGSSRLFLTSALRCYRHSCPSLSVLSLHNAVPCHLLMPTTYTCASSCASL